MLLNYWYTKHPLKSISHNHNFPTKGGIMSEDTERFLLLQKYIPNLYPKLLHPVHYNGAETLLKEKRTWVLSSTQYYCHIF